MVSPVMGSSSNGGTPTPILRATVELTNAQIKALPGGIDGEGITQIVDAPGASQIHRVIGMQLVSRFEVGYGNISSNAQLSAAVGSGSELSDYQIQTIGARDVAGINLPITTLLTNTDQYTLYVPGKFSVEDIGGANYIGNVVAQPLSLIVNSPICLICLNADGNFTGGHANNVLLVTILYTVTDA